MTRRCDRQGGLAEKFGGIGQSVAREGAGMPQTLVVAASMLAGSHGAMDHDAPVRLTIGIAAFRAIAAAVTEAEIGGEVPSVTISQLRPDLELMEGAIGVELTIGDGPDRRRQMWIVAGAGEVVAHLEDSRAEAAGGDDDEERDADDGDG